MILNDDLFVAVIIGELENVKKLLDRGAYVNAKDEDGWTPLHFAADGGYLDIVKLLVDRGADVYSKNKDGKTPIDLAKKEKHSDVVDFLANMTAVEVIDVEHSPLTEGIWGRISVSMRGRGKVKVDLEGDVDWMDTGEILIDGEDEVEIPVKPKVNGEVPVKVNVRGGKSSSKIIWLRVSSGRGAEATSRWIEDEILRMKGFLREVEES